MISSLATCSFGAARKTSIATRRSAQMIYLGREKRTNKRVMIGSSDGRTYHSKQRWGVSVFDFKMPPPPKSGDAKISPVFVGYGRIPGLPPQ